MEIGLKEFEELTQFFRERLKLLPSHSITRKGGTSQRQLKNQQKRKRSQKSVSGRQCSSAAIPADQGSADQETDEVDLVQEGEEPTSVEKDVDAGRERLQRRLHEKIEMVREKTGSFKIKKKSKHEKLMAKMAAKQRRERQKLGRKLMQRQREEKKALPNKPRKRPKMAEGSKEAALQSVAFSEMVEATPVKTGKKRKRKLAEKFRKLAVAQKQKETADQFIRTAQEGNKVLQTEWDHAMQRASGARVLDDPKKLQKSIDDAFKVKAKRAKKWEERKAQEEETKQKRQEKRQRNLQLRADQRRKNKELRKAKKGGTN